MQLVIVIPAHNEAQSIKHVIKSIPKSLPGIDKITTIVVDDHSADETRKIAEKVGARTFRHNLNLGAGGATLTGIEAAKRLNADIVVTLDADGQHDPADIADVIKPIVRHEVDFVLGSRLIEKSKAMPAYKKVGNFLLNLVTYLFFHIWVTDSQSGFKAFSKQALATIELSSNGYEFCSEVVGEVKRHRLRYLEVPITTIYSSYSKRKGQHPLNAINIFLGLLTRNIR